MKNLLLVASIALVSNIALAQKDKEVKYEKLFYKDLTKETNDVIITVDNAVSTEGETKFKLKITNKTADYIIYKPEESKFTINGQTVQPKEKWLVIKPNESDFRVINIKGTGYNSVKSYDFVLDGLYTVALNGETIKTADFKLPASANEFTTGNFKCTLLNSSKETDKTEVKFQCAYNGSKVGVIQPTRAAVKMPDGEEYANAKKSGGLFSKSNEIILMKGQDETYTLKWDRMEGGKKMDMQKVEMNIVWHATFSEVPAVKLNAETLKMEFDEALTQSKK